MEPEESSAGKGADDLLERVKRGEEGALGEAFSTHRDRLWRAVQFRMDRRLTQRIDADDVLQEAYLSAAQRIKHLAAAPGGSLYVWLRFIVLQTMTDLHRRHLGAKVRDARREVSMRSAPYPEANSGCMAMELLGNFTSPSHAAMREEMAVRLEEALESMEALDREVLALRHFEDLTNSEVAEVLGIGQKAASSRYVRALERLKGILQRDFGSNAGSR